MSVDGAAVKRPLFIVTIRICPQQLEKGKCYVHLQKGKVGVQGSTEYSASH